MTEPILFFSPQAATSAIEPAASFARVLASNWYILGKEVATFERDFAAYCGVNHGIGLANGTDALELALRAVGVGPGKQVLLAANAGFYGSTAVNLVGARPVYVDVTASSLTLDPQRVDTSLKKYRPQAIILTHLYGQLADVEEISALARQHGVALIEDCAQSHGALRNGQRAGSFGDIGCFSFYPTKNLGALGDGGAVVCRDDRLASKLLSLRQYGWGRKYHNDMPLGRNSRLDELQAAVLNDKLPTLDADNHRRREIARFYQNALDGLPLKLPPSTSEDYVAHLYVVRTARRDALRQYLGECGVATDIHYPVPDHLQPACAEPGHAGNLPETEKGCATVLSLPCYPGLPQSAMARVASAVRDFFATTD